MKRVVAIAALVASAGPAWAEKNPMQAGLWEYTMKMEMPGMPFAMPPQTFQSCLTQQEVDKGTVVEDPNQKDCKIENLKRAGNKTSYDIVCTGDPPMKGRADFTTNATHLNGVTTIDMGPGQTMKQTFSARRLRDC